MNRDTKVTLVAIAYFFGIVGFLTLIYFFPVIAIGLFGVGFVICFAAFCWMMAEDIVKDD